MPRATRIFRQAGGAPKRRRPSPFHWNSLWMLTAAVTLGISLAAVLAVTKIVYSHANQTINQSIEQSNAQVDSNVASSIDQYIHEMASISDSVANLLNEFPAAELNRRLFVFLREDIETIAVFDRNGTPLVATDNRAMRSDISVTQQSWFTGASTSGRRYLISQPHVQRLYRGEYPWVITLSRSVSWVQNGSKYYGIMIVDMNFSRIKYLCSRDLESGGYIYITDQMGDVVYHPKQQMIYAGVLPKDIPSEENLSEGSSVVDGGGGKLAVCVRTLSNAAWRVIGVTSMNGLATYDGGPDTYVEVAILLLAAAILAGSLFISRQMVQPLHNLMTLMGRVSKGEETALAPVTGIYEAGRLGDSFNRMVTRIRQLMVQVRTEQEQLDRSELKTLNAQINPHFLYNTLDSVVWLAQSGDEKHVVQMVLALSKYFRLSLSGAKDFITAGEELQQVENYLIIQKMRFGDSFTYQITCEDEVRSAQTPKIVLQPIVENAIVHGVGTLSEGGKILIEAHRSGRELEFSVRDNGCGIKPDVLAHILERNPSSRSGIGLKNVHQRIKLACGQEYGLQVESELDEGTVVRVRLPLRYDAPQKGGAE